MPRERRKPYEIHKASERLAWLRDYLWGGSQIDMATETSVYQGSLSNILRGKREPGRELLDRIGNHPRINRTWLLTGDGEPLLDSVVAPVTGEAALHVVKDLFEGLPHDNPECLERYLLPVHRSLFRPSRYWFVVKDGHPLTEGHTIQFGAGDQVLFESDPSRWPSDVSGHPCIVRVRDGRKRVPVFSIAIGTGKVEPVQADEKSKGSKQKPRERIVALDAESFSKSPTRTKNPKKQIVKTVAVGIYREGGFGSTSKTTASRPQI